MEMTPAPISVERYTVTGDIAYPIHEDTNGEYVRHSDYAALLHQLAELEAELEKWRDAVHGTNGWARKLNAAERAREEARILTEDAGSALRVIIATAEAARWPITAEQMVPLNMARKEAGRIAAFLAASGTGGKRE